MKVLVTLLILTLSSLINAQSIDRFLMSGNGNLSSASNIQISATVGEPVVTTSVQNSLILNQGFQQTSASGVGIQVVDNSGFKINIFPNPTIDNLQIEYSTATNEVIQIFYSDVMGRVLYSSPELFTDRTTSLFTIDISDHSAGVYFIKVLSRSGIEYGTYKIIKVR